MKKLFLLTLFLLVLGLENHVYGNDTGDQYPHIQLHGRFQLDAALHDEDNTAFGDGLRARRIRMAMSGDLDPRWSFMLDYDFAEEAVGARFVMLTRKLGGGTLKIGQLKVPMSLSGQGGSFNSTFIERSSNVNAITDFFRMGVGYHYHSRFYGAETMMYSRSMGSGGGGGDDMPIGAAARVYANPARHDGMVTHLGISGAWENRRDYDFIRLNDRPEAWVDNSVMFIDTDRIDGVNTTFKSGLELAFHRGPFLLAAEYLMADIRRDSGSPDLRFDGYHAEISYVLTGESRGYGNGVFGGLRPENSTLGAWEVAARWSSIDLRDEDIEGGKQENLTLGVNWYATDSIRFRANVIFADATESPVASGADDSPTIYLLRAQYHF